MTNNIKNTFSAGGAKNTEGLRRAVQSAMSSLVRQINQLDLGVTDSELTELAERVIELEGLPIEYEASDDTLLVTTDKFRIQDTGSQTYLEVDNQGFFKQIESNRSISLRNPSSTQFIFTNTDPSTFYTFNSNGIYAGSTQMFNGAGVPQFDVGISDPSGLASNTTQYFVRRVVDTSGTEVGTWVNNDVTLGEVTFEDGGITLNGSDGTHLHTDSDTGTLIIEADPDHDYTNTDIELYIDGSKVVTVTNGGDIKIEKNGQGIIISNDGGTITRRVKLNDAGTGLDFETV